MKLHIDWIAGFGCHMSYRTEKHSIVTFHPYSVNDMVIFSIKDGKVVSEIRQSLNYRDYSQFIDFEVPTAFNFIAIPRHRNTDVKCIIKDKEPLFFVPGDYADTLYVSAEAISFRDDGLVKYHKPHAKKPAIVTNRANFEVFHKYHTCFKDFNILIRTDYEEYTEINQYYLDAIEHWKSVGPVGVVGLEDEIKIKQLQVNELKAAMSRWEILDAEDLLRKQLRFLEFPNITEQQLGVKDFWGFKGDD